MLLEIAYQIHTILTSQTSVIVETKVNRDNKFNHYNHNVPNMPWGPHLSWEMIFEVDLNEHIPVKLVKMQFLRNKVMTNTEEECTESGINYQVLIMSLIASIYDDPNLNQEI